MMMDENMNAAILGGRKKLVSTYDSLAINNNVNYDNLATSFSSHCSLPMSPNDDDDIGDPLSSDIPVFSCQDVTQKRSVRNSPWLDNQPLNEVDEERGGIETVDCAHDNLQSEGCSHNEDQSSMLIRSPVRRRQRCNTITEAEIRNELIAMKLREIADKLTVSKSERINRRLSSSHFDSFDAPPRANRRLSHSSFADILPNSCGSTIEFIWSLYTIYREHSSDSGVSSSFPKSQSSVNVLTRTREHTRTRSYTQ